MDELPTEFDVIVVGTGMTGSIIAAALSRIGKSVLHIDTNDYYGEEWASFNLDTLETCILANEELAAESINIQELVNVSETFTAVSFSKRCSRLQQKWHCPSVPSPSRRVDESTETEEGLIEKASDDIAVDGNESDEWTVEKLKNEYRRFNLDLCPKMLYSRGDLVELLISSNIARYAEFKSVSRVLTWRENCLEVVPCSRADVFATKHVSVVQKRMLVKILTLFAEYPACQEEFEGFKNKTFVEYLKHKKLPDQLIHYILYAIAMSTDTTPCLEGVESCQKFLRSLGRYGNTPFIFSLYGSGELPQCFCRLCAVFGGVYHLKRIVNGLIIAEDGSACGIISGGQRLNAKHIVLSSSYCPSHFLLPDTKPHLLRSIYITDRSLVESEKEAVTLLQFPPSDSHDNPVTIMEMGYSCHVAPQGLFLVHMTSEASQNKRAGLKHAKDTLLKEYKKEEMEADNTHKPRILWSMEWEMARGSDVTTAECPTNVKIYSGPDAGFDFDASVKQAKEIFLSICSGEEFLPRAPEPDEIVMDEPPTSNENDSTQESCNSGEGDYGQQGDDKNIQETEETNDGNVDEELNSLSVCDEQKITKSTDGSNDVVYNKTVAEE